MSETGRTLSEEPELIHGYDRCHQPRVLTNNYNEIRFMFIESHLSVEVRMKIFSEEYDIWFDDSLAFRDTTICHCLNKDGFSARILFAPSEDKNIFSYRSLKVIEYRECSSVNK